MPLRPVSELGLADVTDLASPEPELPGSPPAEPAKIDASERSAETETRRGPQGDGTAPRKGSRPARRAPRTPKRSGTTKSRAAGSSPRADRPSRARPKAATGKRTNSRTGGPAAATNRRRPSPRRPPEAAKGGTPAKDSVPLTKSASLEDTAVEKEPTSLVAKLGISVLSSAIGTAGGLYLVKKGLVGRS